MRVDGRRTDQIRPVEMETGFIDYPEGSVLVRMGGTRVLCNVTVESGTPRWKQVQNIPGGWITGEYAMLPRATHERSPRETRGLSGRTQEIRRLIGRSLRAAYDLSQLGPRTFIVDCDVLQADGGTRTAAITGGYVALELAVQGLIERGEISAGCRLAPVAAVSAGVIDGQALLDLNYAEDHTAEVDVNVVMNAKGQFIEVQGTAEGRPFSPETLTDLLHLAYKGIGELLEYQRKIIESVNGSV